MQIRHSIDPLQIYFVVIAGGNYPAQTVRLKTQNRLAFLRYRKLDLPVNANRNNF